MGTGDTEAAEALNTLVSNHAKTLKFHQRRVCFIEDLAALTSTKPSAGKKRKMDNPQDSRQKKLAKAFVDQTKVDYAHGAARLTVDTAGGFLDNFCEPNLISYDEWCVAASSTDELQVDYEKELASCHKQSGIDVLASKLTEYCVKLKRNKQESMKMAFFVGRLCHFIRQREVHTWDRIADDLGIGKTTLQNYQNLYLFLDLYPRFFRVQGLSYTALMKYRDVLLGAFKKSKEIREVWSDIHK